jgi:hypothetical protein
MEGLIFISGQVYFLTPNFVNLLTGKKSAGNKSIEAKAIRI